MTGPVYLDYNATAPMKPAVIEAVSASLAETGNPSSVHRFGRLQRRRMEAAREAVAALAGARANQVVFTSGGTEANNLALRGVGRRVLVSAIEHDSLLKAVPDAERIAVDGDGRVDLGVLAATLARDPRPTLVCVMLANNETGVVQDVAEAARIAHAHGAVVHCDAIQAAGKIAFDMATLGADLLSLSAHKLGGPQGVGALIVGDHIALSPQLLGGGQERGRRAGTENVAAIHGFGVAAGLAGDDLGQMADIANLRDAMETRIAATAPVSVLGAGVARLPNTSCIAMPGVAAETQVMAFDLAGIALGAGSACSSGKVRASHVLAAMGVEPSIADCAIRVSLGWRTMREEIDRFVDAWLNLWTRIGPRAVRRAEAATAAPAA